MRIVIALIILVSTLLVSQTGAAQTSWELIGARDITDEVEAGIVQTYPEYATEDGSLVNVFSINLAPDGQQVFVWAWNANVESILCSYDLDSANAVCGSAPEEWPFPPSNVIWSPDSTRVIFHQDFLRQLAESDLWQFDATTGEILNLTDDGVSDEGRVPPQDAPADFSPFFLPNGDLYFFRANFVREEYGLYRFADEPERVIDLAEALEAQFPLSGDSVVVSDDGSQMAWVVAGASESNLVIVDVEQLLAGSSEAFSLQLTEEDFAAANSTSDANGLAPVAATWAADRVLVWPRDIFGEAVQFNEVNLFSVGDGQIEPLVDWVADAEGVGSELLPRIVASTHGITVLGFHVDFINERAFVTAFPADFSAEPVEIDAFDSEFDLFGTDPVQVFSRVAPNGRLLLSRILFEFQVGE